MACTESGGIKIAFSSDGKVWSRPVRIAEDSNNTPVCVPDLIQLFDGTIVVAYNPRPSVPYTDDRRFGIRCRRSTDNGKTWSDEIYVHDASHTFEDGCWEPSMLQLPSGELQLYFADEGPYTSSGEQQISMCRSLDGGETWGKAEIISFRKGSRDGMPVPALLSDGKTIAVAIEDNGWQGFDSFVPTIVTCPLQTNWHGFWADGGSDSRWKAIDYEYCPRALGGAPYLRVLPWGETVLSHQSDYGAGRNQMWIYVGDEKAQGFKAMSAPFPLSESDNALWNSIAVIDTGVVVAFGGINGHDEIIKGYPVRILQAPRAMPCVDGIQSPDEGYLRPDASQIHLGTQTGTFFTADLAYDRQSLYFTASVEDQTQYPKAEDPLCDGITLYIDTRNLCETLPTEGIYKISLRLDGTVWFFQGASADWELVRRKRRRVKLGISREASRYILEAAIPWKDLGFGKAPVGKAMRANVELTDRRSEHPSDYVVEMLPDATATSSWTWMELRLLP